MLEPKSINEQSKGFSFLVFLRGESWMIALFGIASAYAMYPVLFAPHQRILGWPGDNVELVYLTGWVAHALKSGLSPFVDPHLNYPATLNLAAGEVPFLGMIMVAPVTWMTNPIFSYNLLIFLSHFLSGFFTFLWIRNLTGSRFAGVISGLIFLFSPYRIAHSYAHLELVATQFFPVFFWALDRGITSQRPGIKTLALIAITTFLMGCMSQYYLFIALLAGAIYALLLKPCLGWIAREGTPMILAVVLGSVASAIPYFFASHEGIFSPYALGEKRHWCAEFSDFVSLPLLHPLFGHWMGPFYPGKEWIEHAFYLGFGAILLALASFQLSLPNQALRRRAWAVVALFGFIMALGTDLHVHGRPLQEEHPIWLPAYYFSLLPYLNLMRVWARFAIIPILFIALLAGMGASALQNKFGWGFPGKIICTAMVLFDLIPGRLEAFDLQPRPIDRWLESQPGPFAVAFLPAGVQNFQAMYGSLFHGKRLPAYFHQKHRPKIFKAFTWFTRNFPDSESIELLRELDFRYVILCPEAFDGVYAPPWNSVDEKISHMNEFRKTAEVGGFVILEFKGKTP